MSEPLSAVVFDVGGVLYDWDLRHLFRKLTPDPAEVERIVATVVTPAWHFGHDAGRPLAEMVAERTAQFPTDAAYVHAWATRFNETIPGPVPGMIALVEQLATAGVPLFGITNFGAEFWAGFRPTASVFDHFRDIVVSGVERLTKPDPAIFALAERRFGYRAESMIFIDDRPDNVRAAVARGWHGHIFTDASTLARKLARLGLL